MLMSNSRKIDFTVVSAALLAHTDWQGDAGGVSCPVWGGFGFQAMLTNEGGPVEEE